MELNLLSIPPQTGPCVEPLSILGTTTCPAYDYTTGAVYELLEVRYKGSSRLETKGGCDDLYLSAVDWLIRIPNLS